MATRFTPPSPNDEFPCQRSRYAMLQISTRRYMVIDLGHGGCRHGQGAWEHAASIVFGPASLSDARREIIRLKEEAEAKGMGRGG